ncbi:acyltransferase [Candidatus Woesearchaeota archaeon]|nr:acyltransferase [Candidatus Woesearchaeota archaeon]
MKAIKELGIKKIFRYASNKLLIIIYNGLIFPPLKKTFLKLMGAKIGNNVVLENVKFFNLYRTGIKGLNIGNNCFIGEECLLDMAGNITLEKNVTLGERIVVLTHMNVGYKDHPLQKYYHSITKDVTLREGCFIGTSSTILAGITVGKCSLVAAGSIVIKDVKPYTVVGGNPAKEIKKIKPS